MPRRLAAILFTDIVGYSALAQADESSALEALEQHNRILRSVFAEFHGREIKSAGDSFLVTFDSTLDALDCAVAAQRSVRSLPAAPGRAAPVQIRVGIHVGDVVEKEGDVLGDVVNIASRIVSKASPGGICVSQQVYDQVAHRSRHAFAKLPPTRLKNIRVPVRLYSVAPAESTAVPPPPRRSRGPGTRIAVLPLANISSDTTDGYFADGLTEELISTLSQIRGLQVTARTSVTPYKTTPKPIREVARELGVDTVLEGSVRKAGERIRITLQLVDASTQKHLWSSSFNRVLDDVFAVQIDVAEQTAKALRLELEPSEARARRRTPTPNPRGATVLTGVAYDDYLRGLAAAERLEGNQPPDEAVRWFEQATALDPTFADAYAAWANVNVVAAGDSIPMREAIPKARALAQRALALDPRCSGAHAALGNIALQYDNDWVRSEEEFLKAIELNPSNITAYRFYGLLLMTLGRFEEAKGVLRRAALLDPNGHDHTTLGWAEVESGNFDEGIRIAEQVRNPHDASFPHRMRVGFLYLQAGRRDDALRSANLPLPTGASENEEFDHALLNALLGRTDQARRMLAAAELGRTTSYTSATHLAMLYSVLGERDKAVAALERDLREGDRVLWLYYRGVFFDPIRTDPRFISLLRELRLPLDVRRGPTRGPN